jgi:hypothetical protein
MNALKIKSMTPVKVDKVYDLEIPNNHNFILSNGIVAHNCAYSELGYITMYLKHYHSIEWWTSVLNSEKNEDKMRYFVSLLGDKIKNPSLKYPAKDFKPLDNKIVAPISVIKGIGPKMLDELVDKGPFDSVADFLNKVSNSKVNVKTVSVLIKGRVADDLMDPDIPYYEARKKFMEDYIKLRKNATPFGEEMFNFDPLVMYLQEREVNKCFNRTLLSDKTVVDKIVGMWSKILQKVDNPLVPLFVTLGKGSYPVLNGMNFMDRVFKDKGDKTVATIALFESSRIKKGISKKSGRPWSLFSMELSDGVNVFETMSWDIKSPLNYPKDSLVFVLGRLKEGWRTVSLEINDVERIE